MASPSLSSDHLLLSLPTLEILSSPAQPRVAHVWLNRPSKRNALSSQALQDIVDAFAFLDTAFTVSVVVLGGRGKGFCCGADLKDPPGQPRKARPRPHTDHGSAAHRATRTAPDPTSTRLNAASEGPAAPNGRERRWAMQLGRRAIEAIEACEALTIARVHGHAVGGGFGLMAACDLRLCTRDTKLCVPEVDLGMPLTWGLTARMIRDVGRAKAMELITLCDDLPTAQAAALGFVNAVAADEAALDDLVGRWVGKLALKSPTALHMVKCQFRALDRQATTGDVTESDNDLLFLTGVLEKAVPPHSTSSPPMNSLHAPRTFTAARHVAALRTPDSAFAAVPDYPFTPRYFESTRFCSDLGPLRIHYLDEGPADATETVLLLHGEPSWSFLYRHMIPPLVANGYRCVAPDLVGFGKSDKPTDDALYTFAQHLEWLDEVLGGISPALRGTTVVMQDWGGILGLRLLADDIAAGGGRFARAVVANTTLTTGDAPCALRGCCADVSEGFYIWKDWVHTARLAGPSAIGDLLARATGSVSVMPDAVKHAYDCPFPSEEHKAGARRFPELVPTPSTDATGRPQSNQAAENAAAWGVLAGSTLPMLCAFSDEDPIFGNCCTTFLEHVPGTKGQPHTTIGPGVGHFLQDKGGAQLAEAVASFIEVNPNKGKL